MIHSTLAQSGAKQSTLFFNIHISLSILEEEVEHAIEILDDEWLHTFIALFVITFSHLSYNKSSKFLILNVYFTEDNHGEKENKIKKYQLNLDLTRSIWLEKDDPKSN